MIVLSEDQYRELIESALCHVGLIHPGETIPLSTLRAHKVEVDALLFTLPMMLARELMPQYPSAGLHSWVRGKLTALRDKAVSASPIIATKNAIDPRAGDLPVHLL